MKTKKYRLKPWVNDVLEMLTALLMVAMFFALFVVFGD